MDTDKISATIPDSLLELDEFLSARESQYDLKPETEAKIIWNDKSTPEQTDVAIVYLHGFRASRLEGNPTHIEIAKKLGCNLFLARLEEHGIKTEQPLIHLTEEKLLNSARFAFEIGRRIGKKVILMGTSTGASLALYLAAQQRFIPEIEALVLYSPLIHFYGSKERLLKNSWFRRLFRIILGKKHIMYAAQNTEAESLVWYDFYTLQGALALGAFVQHNMHKNLFSRVKCPVFVGYYYKDESEHDKVVSVSAIKKMVSRLGTRAQFLKAANFPEAKTHVICSSLASKSVSKVISETIHFLKTVVSQ